MKKLLACALALLMIAPAVLAEGKSYTGTVVSTETSAVLAPAAGVIAQVNYQAGMKVGQGDAVAQLLTTAVYAEEAGTVKVFGSAGEAVETVTARCGAVIYLEPDRQLTLIGNTAYAYDKAENKVIRPGETVYLRSTSTASYTGVGLVTALNGTKYTVEVLSGNLLDNQLVCIYRNPAFTAISRIGRGTVKRSDALALSGAGTGVISEILVADGAHVEAGTPLFTTIEASAYDWQMTADEAGVISMISVAPGAAVEADALIAEIYPDSARRLQLIVEGRELRTLREGLAVQISFDNGVTAAGEVERVSAIPYVPDSAEAEDADETVYFAVYVTFASDACIPYGMTAKACIQE